MDSLVLKVDEYNKHSIDRRSSTIIEGKQDELLSSSSSVSSCRSESPEPIKCTKKTKNMLLRVIGRLRAENESLRSTVNILKNDLRDLTTSGQDHRKFCDEYIEKNSRLQLDLQDRDDEINRLKKELENIKRCNDCQVEPDVKPVLEEEDDTQALQDYLNRRFSLTEDIVEEEEPVNFEQLMASFIHQAILSKLSSYRVQLDLDSYILQYEATNQVVLKVLAVTFLHWLMLKSPEWAVVQKGLNDFWGPLLENYTKSKTNQIEFLYLIEQHFEQINTRYFLKLMLILYKVHVIDDDAIIHWWRLPLETDESRKLRKLTIKFYEWLIKDDEDDEDEEEEEDEDDDDLSIEFVNTQTEGIDNLLIQHNQEFCACDTKESCLCSTPSGSPPVLEEKKKKSVRISAM